MTTSPPRRDLAGAADAADLAQRLVDQACAVGPRPRGGHRRRTRWWPTTWPTPRRRWPRRGPPWTTARRATSRPASPAAFVADVVADLVGRVAGREQLWGVEPRVDRAGGGIPGRRSATRPSWRGLAATRGPAPPGRRLRAGPRDLPPLRRGQGPPARRARAPDQRRHPRGDHRGPGRAGRLRALGPRGVRRLRHGRGERLHGHGRGHRGAELGLAGRRRLAHHPARDPDPGPGLRRHRGAEAALAAQAGHRPRSWPPWP